MNSRAVEEWLRRYESSELRPGAIAPDRLKLLAQGAGLVVASDAPRAQMSASAIVGAAPVAVSPLLREIPLDIPRFGNVRLPLLGWALLLSVNAKLRGRWTDGSAPRLAAQVSAATQLLLYEVERHASVFAVVHANLRTHLAEQLVGHGWMCQDRTHRYAHWSSWTFVPSGTAGAS